MSDQERIARLERMVCAIAETLKEVWLEDDSTYRNSHPFFDMSDLLGEIRKDLPK